MLALLLGVGVRVAGLVGPAARTVVAGHLGAALGLLGRLVLRAFGRLGRVVLAVLVLDRVGVSLLSRLVGRGSAGEETDRLAQLADDLLLLASVDSGKLPLRRTRVPIAEVLDTIATRFRRRAADAGRSIEAAAPSDLVALVDRRRFEQALANPVRLEAVEDPGALTIHVTDQGQGFPPQFLEHAFERFTRADGSRAGAGLGLAIVAAIAHAHGGTAMASNAPAQGADVALAVPVAGQAERTDGMSGD